MGAGTIVEGDTSVVTGPCHGMEEVIEPLEKAYKITVPEVHCLLANTVKECGVPETHDVECEKNNLPTNCSKEVDLESHEETKKHGRRNTVRPITVLIGIISPTI